MTDIEYWAKLYNESLEDDESIKAEKEYDEGLTKNYKPGSRPNASSNNASNKDDLIQQAFGLLDDYFNGRFKMPKAGDGSEEALSIDAIIGSAVDLGLYDPNKNK